MPVFTSAVLDDFNRANENPIGLPNWAPVSALYSFGARLTSNEVQGPAAGTAGGGYYQLSTYGAACDVAVKISNYDTATDGSLWDLLSNINNPTNSATVTCYSARFTCNLSGRVTSISIRRYNSSTPVWNVNLAETVGKPIVAGTTKFGLRVEAQTYGTVVSAWMYDSTDGWVRYAAVNDTVISGLSPLGSGSVGFGLTGTSGSVNVLNVRIDDFAAGNVSTILPADAFDLFALRDELVLAKHAAFRAGGGNAHARRDRLAELAYRTSAAEQSAPSPIFGGGITLVAKEPPA